MGIAEIDDELLPSLKLLDSQPILEAAEIFCSIDKNSQNIVNATNKVSKVFYVLKSFLNEKPVANKKLTNINQSISQAVEVYRNLMQQGGVINFDFGELPEVTCHRSELYQVWSNILTNALHAVAYKGQIDISTRVKNGNILVKFKDSGVGVNPEHLDAIFEPFFTTRPKAEGMGLGLNICTRIIGSMRGDIKITSSDSGTEVTVSLPIVEHENEHSAQISIFQNDAKQGAL
jgi:C4-dicarboxylate-specific signal transduction histidine kinase